MVAFDLDRVESQDLIAELVGGNQPNDGDILAYRQEEGWELNPPDVTAFNVKRFGAQGDGSTDDTEAVRSAAIAAIGGVLYFPPGTYLLTDQITIGDGVLFSTVRAYDATLDWTAFGSVLATTIPARAATGNAIRMLSHTAWYGGRLTMTNVGTPSNISIPAANMSGAFWNVFAIGHFNTSTVEAASFDIFTENIAIYDVDFDLVLGGGNSFILIAGAAQQIRCTNLRMVKTSTDNTARTMIEATWGGSSGITYHPHDIRFNSLTMIGSGNTSDLTDGFRISGAYDTHLIGVYATGIDKMVTFYIGDPGDPRGAGDTVSSGVPVSAQKGRIGKGLSLTNFTADDFDIAVRVLGDADGSTHEERRSHDMNVVISNINLRGQGSGVVLTGSWLSNDGIVISDANNVIVRDGLITECFIGIAISGTSAPGQAVTSITRSGQIATVTTTLAHQIEPDDEVVVAGANEGAYKGVVRVDTVPSTTVFTYEVAGTPTTPATGTILVGRFTPPSHCIFENLEIFNNSRNGISSGDLNHPIIRGNKIYNSRLNSALATAAHLRISPRGGVIEGNQFSLSLSEVTPYCIYNTAVVLLTGPLTLVRNNTVLGAATDAWGNILDLLIDKSNISATGVAATFAVSANRGDASVTINAGANEEIQRFDTVLTANRTVTLGTGFKGAHFRIVRTGLGAFTLDVGGLKTIASATAAFVDVHYDGTAWVLTGFGAL